MNNIESEINAEAGCDPGPNAILVRGPRWYNKVVFRGMPDGKRITNSEMSVLFFIGYGMEDDSVSRMSLADLCELIRKSKRTIMRATRHFEECGLISKTYDKESMKTEFRFIEDENEPIFDLDKLISD